MDLVCARAEIFFTTDPIAAPGSGQLSVDAGQLILDKRVLMHRDQAVSATLQQTAEGKWVVKLFAGDGLAVECAFCVESDAKNLLYSLGVGPCERLATLRLDVPTGSYGALFFLLMYVMIGFGIIVTAIVRGRDAPCWAAHFALVPTFMLAVAFLRLPRRVKTGNDGMVISYWIGRRFIAWDRVAQIIEVQSFWGTAAQGIYGNRRRVRLWSADPADQHVLVAQLRRRKQEYDQLSAMPSSALQHHAQSGDQAPDGSPYRRLAVSDSNLWSLVEDPRLPPQARVSATRTLSVPLSDDARHRLRTVAKATARPSLRAAFEAIAKG